MNIRHEFLRRATMVMADLGGHQSLSVPLCRAMVDVLGAEGGAIVLKVGTDRTMVCSTGEVAQNLEEIQDLARQGPSYDAMRSGVPVAVGDLAAHSVRWPRLVAALHAAGLPTAGIDAAAMTPGQTVVGVVSVHREPRVAAAASLNDLQFVADVVGAVLVEEMLDEQRSALTWAERDVIAQATGMVVAHLEVAPRDALALLRARAFADGTTLSAISRMVVDRRLRFDADGGGA